VAPNAVAFVNDNGVVGMWILRAGTESNVDGVSHRPLDYDADTNAKYWAAVALGAPTSGNTDGVTHPIQQTPSNVYTVDASATGLSNGQSWPDAFTTVQAAIDAAKLSVGKKIWIKAGTYYPTSNNAWNVGDNRCKHFKVANNIPVYGGFAGWEGSLAERDVAANKVYWSNEQDNNYHILRHADTSYLSKDTCLIDGIYFRGGSNTQADGASDEAKGAGILFTSGHGITLVNCTFQGLKCVGGGAAISLAANCQLVIDNCTFTGCTGVTSGAINATQAMITATGCTFTGNTASGATANCGGAAINVAASTLSQGIIATNCIFRNNLCPTSSVVDGIGGGACRIKPDPGTAIFTGCYFEGNTGYYAGALYIVTGGTSSANGSNVLVSQCSFLTNTARYGILFLSATNGIVDRCVLQENYISQSATLYVRYNSPKIYNTLISGNKSELYSAGIYLNAVLSGTVVVNCTIVSNHCAHGAAFGVIGASVLDIYNTIMWGNVASVRGNCITVESGTVSTYNCCYPSGSANGVEDIFLNGVPGGSELYKLHPCEPHIQQSHHPICSHQSPPSGELYIGK